MARTIGVAVLVALLPVFASTAETPRFHFALPKPAKFVMKQTTILLDDDERGIPHRIVVIESSDGTIAPAEGGFHLIRKPTSFEVLVDGHHIDSEIVGSVVKQATITLTINSQGLALSGTGYEDVQKSVTGSPIVSKVLPRDLAGRDVASWNDLLLMTC